MKNVFKEAVYSLVSSIPAGRVMAYGQIAAICGHPGAAQVVGQIAHFGPKEIPWHRVVNVKGGTARGFPWGGPNGQSQMLIAEKVKVIENQLVLQDYLWWPKL